MKFAIGERVIVEKFIEGGRPQGYVGIITRYSQNIFNKENDIYYLDNGSGSYEKELKLYSSNTNSMDLKEKFLLAITAEPQKSFRKTGITNGDDLFTEDGQKIFLSWLLKKHQDEFKKDIVDGILDEQEKENK